MKVWIYLDGQQQGPFELEELKSKPGFDRNTRVWFEGLPKWYPAGELEQLTSLFAEDTVRDEGGEIEEVADTVANADDVMTGTVESAEPAMKSMPDDNPYAPGRVYRPVVLDEPCPPTYLGWSVFLFICCCSPVSLGALAASIFVSSYYGRGDLGKAKKASEWAAWLVMISIALGMLPMMFMSAFMG